MYEEFNYVLNGFDELFAGPGEQVLGGGNNPRVFEGRTTFRNGGFFVQEMLGLNDKLFLTAGMRWDGFSTFGEGFGLAAYPKVQAAYTISDEDFFPFDFAETFKLRAAWGRVRQGAGGPSDAKRIYEAVSADEQVPAVIIANLGNADLGPEVSSELEYGVDASFLNGRVSVEFTAYDQTTRDALIGVQEAPSGGTEEATLRNLGEVRNWGTETLVNFVPRSDPGCRVGHRRQLQHQRQRNHRSRPAREPGPRVGSWGFHSGFGGTTSFRTPTPSASCPTTRRATSATSFPHT